MNVPQLHDSILPYIEQGPLYKQLKVNERRLYDVLQHDTDRYLVQAAIQSFRCPSDVTPEQLPTKVRHFHGKGNVGKIELGTSNYVACHGLYDPGNPNPFRNNGAFYNDSAIKFRDITDGTSRTFLLGERDQKCGSGVWAGCRNPPGPCHWGTYHNRGRVSIKLNSPKLAWPRESDSSWPPGASACNSCGEGFSSAHPGGANFAFCDGSVHFISENIDFSNAGLTQSQLQNNNMVPCEPRLLGLYQRLGIRDDKQTVEIEF